MDVEPRWLSADVVIGINQSVVRRTGEPFLLRDRGLLESAVARPRQLWAYEGVTDAFVLAARLMRGVGQNHPFTQGNKRTAFLAGLGLLAANGVETPLQDGQAAADLLEPLIVGEAGEAALADLLRTGLKS